MRAIWTQARADAPALALLGLAVLATSVLASVLPRQVSATAQAALVAAVADAPAPVRDIRATYIGSAQASGLAAADRAIVAAFPPELTALVADSRVTTSTRALAAVPADGTAPRSPQVRLVVRSQDDLADVATWVEGRAPRGPAGTANTVEGELPLVEVGLSTHAAGAVDLSVGDLLVLTAPTRDDDGGTEPARRAVLVTGLFTAADGAAATAAWEGAGPVFTAFPEVGDTGDVVAEHVVAVTAPPAVDMLVPLGRLSTTWRYPVDLSRLRADDVHALDAAVDEAARASITPPRGAVPGAGGSTRIRVASGLPALLADYREDVATARSLAAVTMLGLGAIAATVLALAALQLSTRRSRAVALARSRGFSLVQVLTATAPPTLLLVVSSAVLGLVAGALLVPGRPWAVPTGLVSVVAAAAVVAAAMTTVVDYRRGAQLRTQPAHPARRLTAEVGVLAATALGVVLLQRRGLTGAGADADGVDPYLALVPVLLALSAALVALRLGPIPLALAARVAGAGRGAATFVGLSSAQRTTRSGPVAAAALVVLVVALAFSVFASALSTSVAEGQQRASWHRLGADLSVTGSGLNDGVVRAVSAVPGVSAVVPAFRDDTATLSAGRGQPAAVVVLALDPVDYASARARAGGTEAGDLAALSRLPSTPTPAGTVPALVAETGGTSTFSGPATLTLGTGIGPVDVDVIAGSTAVPFSASGETPVLLVPAAALDEALPDAPQRSLDQLLVMATPAAAEQVATTLASDPSALGATVPATLDVALRAEVLADLDAQPLVTGTRATLTLGVLVAGGYGLLTVTLALVAGARSRRDLLPVLRTLGLRRRSARLLLAVELAPLVFLAVLSGAAAGLALLPATAPALDLRPYTGGQADPALAVDPAHVLALAAATLALVATAAVVTALLDHRRHLGTALRMGGTP